MQPKYYGAAANYNSGGAGIGGNLLKIIALVVGVLVLITIGFFAFNAITSGPRDNAARLVVRERQLLSFMNTNQEKIASDNLRTINSTAISLLTSDTYALQQGLRSAHRMTLDDIPGTITASEADAKSASELTAAQVQSRFDQVYVQILRNKIASSLKLANEVLGQSRGSLKTAVQTSISNLKNIDQKLGATNL